MIAKELLEFKNWCVVGDVGNSTKYANRIFKKLESKEFNVSGVHPKGGEQIYETLKEVPYKIEVIDLCINSFSGLKYIKEANELGIDKVLIQPGAESDEIVAFCKENGITAIEGCALVELGRM